MAVSWHRRAPLPWILALCAILALFGAHAGRSFSFTVDDAAITFTYARNLADGHGLVLTPGGERVEGATNLLWTLAIAPARVFGLGFDLFAKLLGIAFAGLGIAGVALFPAALRGREPRYFDLVAPLLVALMPNYAIWAGSGLENGLYAALVAWSLHAVAREEHDPERFPWSAALLWLLFLTRPDGSLYAVAVGIAKLFRHIVPKRPRRQDVLWALAFAAGIGATELFRLAYFAWPFPNTFYSKTRWYGLRQSLFDLRSDGWTYLGWWLYSYRLLFVAPLALGAIFGPKPHGARLALVGCTAVALLFPVAVQGDWMGEFRFLTNGALLLSLCLCEGARSLFTIASRLTPRAARAALRWIATPLLAIAVLRYAGRFYPERWAAAMQHNTIGMEVVGSRIRYFERAQHLLAIDGRPSILESDIGGTSFDGRFAIVDMLGLAHVGAAHSFPSDPPGFREVLLGEDPPTFVRMHPTFAGTYELPRLEEISNLYFLLPATLGVSIDTDPHYVRRAVVAAPYLLTAARVASSAVGTPDGVTLSHERPEPRSTVFVDIAFGSVDRYTTSAVILQDERGIDVARVEAPPLGGIVEPGAVLPGERPRARARLMIPRAGRFRVLWRGASGASVVLGELDARPGASAVESRELDRSMDEHLRADRFDRVMALSRTLSLRVVAAPSDTVAKAALGRLARALADRARTAVDARAYAVAAAIAREARKLAPWDPQTIAACGAVAERIADASSEAEARNQLDRAFELARDAVLVDPRRSWSRRRAELLRSRRVHSYDGGRALAAYRAAAAAIASRDANELDRTIVFLGSANQWLEAAWLSERASHTPRDPAARVVVARGLVSQGRAREALALVSGVPCREAHDAEVTRALRAIVGGASYRPNDDACEVEATGARGLFDERVGSFETERFAQWTTTGDAFGAGPVSLARCGAQWINGWRGRRYASSIARCEERAQGTLRSPVFVVRSEALSFLVGGGTDLDRTGVRLALEDGTTLLRSVAVGHDGMVRTFWDLRAIAGRRVFIEAYDRTSEGVVAHVTLDDVREEPVLPAGVAALVAPAPP